MSGRSSTSAPRRCPRGRGGPGGRAGDVDAGRPGRATDRRRGGGTRPSSTSPAPRRTPTDEEEKVATRLDRAAEPAKDEEKPVDSSPGPGGRADQGRREDRRHEARGRARRGDPGRRRGAGRDPARSRRRAGDGRRGEGRDQGRRGPGDDAGGRVRHQQLPRRRHSARPRRPPVLRAEFGRELSDTKVHTDAHAARLASSLNAQAFTVGRDIYMAAGKYQPGTESGRSLLAHELTHTVQQQPGAKLERASGDVASSPNPALAPRTGQRADDDDGGEPASGEAEAPAAPPRPAPTAADPGVVDATPPTITYPSSSPPIQGQDPQRREVAAQPIHAQEFRPRRPKSGGGLGGQLD